MIVFMPTVMHTDNMVSDTTAYVSLLLVMMVGMAGILYGMFLSAGQSVNAPSIAGGIILIAGLAMMLYVSVSAFEAQEQPSYGQD